MIRKILGMLLMLLWATAQMSAAEIVRGRWEKVEALRSGTGIIVKLKAGDRIEGAYQGLWPEELRVKDLSGAELRLPKSSVLSVETAEKVRDRLGNGALIGAGAGAAAGFFSLLGFAKAVTASGPIMDREAAGYYFSAAMVGAGIGAVAGVVIDSRIKQREILYLSR
jgi:hypothetical protein